MTIDPSTPHPNAPLRIGVDVGGTNTDAVILDLTPGSPNPVLATCKAPTTPDVTTGIQRAIAVTLEKANVDRRQIQAVAIGTTSFVNSLIERDASKLDRVGVIRLCGPFSRLCPPFASFPYELRNVLEGPVFFASGGVQVDGSEILSVDPLEIRSICAEMASLGVRSVAVSGCYSPIDTEHRQEELVRDIVRAELPHAFVTISKEVGNIGLLERENATILNAALLTFAAKTVKGFQASTVALNLNCPLFLTSNDGTLMTCEQAVRLPIRTFSSGPTNSMRGAHFLASLSSGKARRETALVIDVGGTTTEVGVLLPTGFPRQAGAFHQLCGVRLNFPMPHVVSIGLGGGSRIRKVDGKTTVGPDSVGYRITEEALCFGGSTLTATDIVVAAGRGDGVGHDNLAGRIPPEDIAAAQARMKTMIELVADSMKTSEADVPVYLVGGGAILVPDELHGVSQVHRFPHYEAANAVGAACAQVSAVVDTFEDTSTRSVAEVQRIVEARAIERAIANGADAASTVIVESEAIPIAYTTGRCRFYVKAAGEWTGAHTGAATQSVENDQARKWDSESEVIPATAANGKLALPVADAVITAADILAYRPNVQAHEWILSELDLEWIATGCYILGTGGGGNPATTMLAVRELVRSGAKVRVVDIDSLDADKMVCWGGGIGSPEVVLERLDGGDPALAITSLLEFMGVNNCGALAALEIGGSNGMFNMLAGSSRYLDLPIIDGDFMGRAYPTGWQTTVQVFDSGDRAEMTLPNAMTSGDGSNVFMTSAKHYKDVDKVLRASCVEMGTHANVACRPLTRAFCQQSLVRNTISQSWRLGRAVALATKQSNIDAVGNILVDAVGGGRAARVLFAGKITELGRYIHKGHTYGEITIVPVADDGAEFSGVMKIPFKNENLLCKHVLPSGEEKIVAGVPDLISVLDAQNGFALGTPEYKYGQRVLVLGMTAAPQWTGSQRGLELGALPAFGYDIPYVALGEYVRPLSVIAEYGGR